MGFAVANMSLSNSAHVTISGSTQSKVDEKVALLRSFYPNMPAANVSGYACNLLDKDALESNIKDLLEKATEGGSKKINHIAFTAGDSLSLPKVADVSVESALAVFTMRYAAPAIIAKLLATGKYMPLDDTSSFTLTSGTNSYRPAPGWAFVAPSGGAVEGLARGLAVDMKPLRVNVVCPGAIETELLKGMLVRIGEEETRKFRASFSLTDTFGPPEDIAEAYGYIMKDRFANGSVVTSDGGRLLLSPP